MADEMNPEQPQQSQMGLSQAYLDSVMARKQEAERQMQKLMDALNVRKNMPFDPVLMRVAGALLQPTKTGSFGESLGYATTAAAEEGEKQAMRGIDLAKLEFELGQKKLEQQKGMDALKLRQQFFGGKPAASAAPAAAPVAVQPLTDVPQASTPEAPAMLPEAMPPVAPPSMVSTAPPAPPAAPAGYQRQMPTGMDALLMMESDPELYKLLSEEDKRRLEEAKFGLDVRKTEATERVPVEVGGVKISMSKADFDRMTGSIEKGDFDTAKKYYTKYGLDFPFVKDEQGWRRKTASEAAREEAVARELGVVDRRWKGETYKLDSFQAAEHDKARKAGKLNEFWNNYFIEQSGGTPPAAPSGGASAKTTAAKVEPVPSEEKKEVSQEAAKTREKKRAEETINFETNLTETAKQSGNLRRTANTVLSLINDEKYSGAQGYFAQPGLKNAIATFLEEGFQFGNSRVALPGLTEAFKKIGMTPQEAEAEAILFQKTGELGLLISKLQAGQGSVSNYERSVFEKIATSTKTPLIAMRSAMNALRARAVYDENIQKVYVDWSEKNPNKSSAAFIASTEYKRETARYENQLGMIEDQFFPKTKAAKPAAKSEAKPEGKPSSKFLQ
jgi:hypothetical protein